MKHMMKLSLCSLLLGLNISALELSPQEENLINKITEGDNKVKSKLMNKLKRQEKRLQFLEDLGIGASDIQLYIPEDENFQQPMNINMGISRDFEGFIFKREYIGQPAASNDEYELFRFCKPHVFEDMGSCDYAGFGSTDIRVLYLFKDKKTGEINQVCEDYNKEECL